MKISKEKKISLSISSANQLGWGRGRGGRETATPRGQNHVNNLNNFFLKRKWCNPVDLRHLAVEKFKN